MRMARQFIPPDPTKLSVRHCEYCGKKKPWGIFAFVNPFTKKPGYWHPACFRKFCKEGKP